MTQSGGNNLKKNKEQNLQQEDLLGNIEVKKTHFSNLHLQQNALIKLWKNRDSQLKPLVTRISYSSKSSQAKEGCKAVLYHCNAHSRCLFLNLWVSCFSILNFFFTKCIFLKTKTEKTNMICS